MLKSSMPILIAGGGPAGSSLAVRLAGRGMDVILVEREKFPREKLCGQFISPECFAHFQELGVLDEMLSSGGDRITETIFFESGGRSVAMPTGWFHGGRFALSLSRARMDAILLGRARRSGVCVLEQTTVTNILTEDLAVRGVTVRGPDGRSRDIPASLVIDATGRRRAVTKLAVQTTESPSTFVAFKTDLGGVATKPGTCEIYGFRGGYGGLSFVEGGVANLCFLAKSSLVRECGSADGILETVIPANARARRSLLGAERICNWLAVAITGFGYQEPSGPGPKGLLSVGDAAAFIDPFTGSGILMALEGAQVLDQCISDHQTTADILTADYTRRLRARFDRRLRLSRLLRAAAFVPGLARPAVTLLSASTTLSSAVARLTRPSVPAALNRP